MELVTIEVRERVGIVSLNRPERHNAVSNVMKREIHDALRQVAADDEIRAVLFRGEGRSFSSGRDTSELGTSEHGETAYDRIRALQDEHLFLYDLPKPTVAAMKGATLGMGLEMCLACDMRIGASDLRVGLPEIDHGILPDTGGTHLLLSLLGPSRTKELVMTGKRIDARTAYEWGIVNHVVPVEELDEAAFTLARQLAAAPPLAMRIAKDTINDAWRGQVHAGMRQELLSQCMLHETEDYHEARSAWREKRPGQFKGR
jgi:enoyl-CoA hydratase